MWARPSAESKGCSVSKLPHPPSLEKHGHVPVLADLEYGTVLRGGQAGQGSRALDRPAQLEGLGGDAEDGSEGDQGAVESTTTAPSRQAMASSTEGSMSASFIPRTT